MLTMWIEEGESLGENQDTFLCLALLYFNFKAEDEEN